MTLSTAFSTSDKFTRMTFDKYEEKQIKDAFLEGIISMRSRSGTMSEACHRTFYSLGIHSGTAQHAITMYFSEESETAARTGVWPTPLDTENFLVRMTYQFKGSLELHLARHGRLNITEGNTNESQSGQAIAKSESDETRRRFQAVRVSTEKRKSSESVRSRSRKTKTQ